MSTHLQRMGGVNRVDLTPDETLVLTAGQERRLTFWDLREHDPVSYRDLSPPGHDGHGEDEGKALAVS